jgi:hypothetical protein
MKWHGVAGRPLGESRAPSRAIQAPAKVAGALMIASRSLKPLVQWGFGVTLHRKYPADPQYRCHFGKL